MILIILDSSATLTEGKLMGEEAVLLALDVHTSPPNPGMTFPGMYIFWQQKSLRGLPLS